MSNIIPFEYDGHPIRFNEEGWINATDVAAKFGKEPTAWLRQVDVLEYMAALSKKLFGNSGFLTEISKIKRLDTSSAASRTKVLKFVKNTGLVNTKTGPQGMSPIGEVTISEVQIKDVYFKTSRWVVERTHSWMNRYRRILIRWEKKISNYEGMLYFCCGLLVWNTILLG